MSLQHPWSSYDPPTFNKAHGHFYLYLATQQLQKDLDPPLGTWRLLDDSDKPVKGTTADLDLLTGPQIRSRRNDPIRICLLH